MEERVFQGRRGGEEAMFQRKRTSGKLEIRFSSLLDRIDAVCREAKVFLERAGERRTFPAELALREGLLNAVLHGNKGDSGKTVRFSLERRGRWWMAQVQDEGEGFPWRERLTGKFRKDTLSESGRGLLIMKSYSRAVWYNKKGNRLNLLLDAEDRGSSWEGGAPCRGFGREGP